MTIGLSAAPQNQNLAQASKFLLSFDRLPYITWFCKRANIPGISAGEAVQVNPLIDAPLPGDKMVYAPLEITYLLDEELYSYTTLLDWIKGITFPDSFQEYKKLSLQQKLQMQNSHVRPQYSDATLTVLTNKNNPVMTVKFIDVFPIAISGIDFDTSVSAETILTATGTFKFTNYHIERS